MSFYSEIFSAVTPYSHEIPTTSDNTKGRELYRITRETLGWKTTGPPSSLVEGGKLLNKPAEIAECLATFFKEKIIKLKKGLPPKSDDPLKLLKSLMDKWTGSANRVEFELEQVSLKEVIETIGQLSNSTTMDNDCLDALTLKLVSTHVSKPIQYILNLSISSSIYCNKWKLGKVLPLFKGGKLDKMSCKSYRPISLLPLV